MYQLLKQYNYIKPIIKPYETERLKVDGGRNPYIRNNELVYRMIFDNTPQMGYSFDTHKEAFELFPQYYIASGHCVCTGLGFGIRENWLLNKKEVTKITIIEKNEEILEYHKHIKSAFLDHCEVIIADAEEVKMSCDTLLLDHYDKSYQITYGIANWEQFVSQTSKKISNNIQCNSMWFWTLEDIIRENKFKFGSLLNSYNNFKNISSLTSLPNLDEETLELICFISSL